MDYIKYENLPCKHDAKVVGLIGIANAFIWIINKLQQFKNWISLKIKS
jgi:hypothetical protein